MTRPPSKPPPRGRMLALWDAQVAVFESDAGASLTA
jgi:hypothetical protein